MVYRVETVCGWQEADAWRKASTLQGPVTGKALRAASGLGKLWSAGMLLLGTFLVVGGCLGGVANLLTAVGVLCLLWGSGPMRNRSPLAALKNRQVEAVLRRETPDTPLRASFAPDGFDVWAAGNAASYRYHALTDVWEDPERYYLILQGDALYLLPKAGFTQGDPACFGAFLAEQTGLTVKTMD